MRIFLWIDYPKRRPIANSRVRMSSLGLDPDNRFSLFQTAVEHFRPQFEVLGWTLGSMGAGASGLDYSLEIVWVTGTDERESLAESFLGMLVIDRDSIAHDVLFVPLAAEPLGIFLDLRVVLESRPFQSRVRVLEPEDELAIVHPRIVMRQDHSAERTDVEDKVRVGSETSLDQRILVSVWKRSQCFRIV